MTNLSAPTAPTALTFADRQGETLRAQGNVLVIKTASPRATVIDYTAPAGFPGPPLHVHPGFDEVFVVLEGTLTVRVNDAVSEIGPVGSASVAGAVPHTFANETADPVRFLLVAAPGGIEDYFRALVTGDEAGIDAFSTQFGYQPVPGA
jgi:mannose-6-phosphate isomerase-like protein (cupin superfamily)